jgi:hypothetical protein
VISFGAHGSGQFTTRVLVVFRPIEDKTKVAPGLPAEISPGLAVVVGTVESLEHLPTTALILSFEIRE